MNREEFIKEEIGKAGVEITDEQANQFLKYYEMLVEKNKVMNLTAITDFEDVVRKHFADSLSIAAHFDLNSVKTMIDVGTGAGFPGMPIKIIYPQIETVLADSLQKRLKFLDEVVENLNLDGISTVHGRAEDLARKKEYREAFDLCASRAVARLSTLSEYCLPFVKEGGYFLSYKAGNCREEIDDAKRAIRLLGGQIEHIDRFELDGMERCLIAIKKVRRTPALYPRKAGTPSKKPL